MIKSFARLFKGGGVLGRSPESPFANGETLLPPKNQEGTVEVWETQLGGLPMNLHRKFIKAKTPTHGFNLNDKSFSYGFVLLMIENHQFLCAKQPKNHLKDGIRRF